jgi:hypothetical protein
MQGLIRCGLIAGLLLGCNAGGVDPTGDDVMPPSDAPAGPHGLVIEWSSSPTLPGSGNPSVEQARFYLEKLRVVGDIGEVEHPMTGDLRFNWSGSEPTPMSMTFDDLPTGRYSQISLTFDGGSNDAYEIRGHVDVNSNDYEYRIEDSNRLAFTVQIDAMVMPGMMTLIKLRINFTNAIDSVDWENVNVSDGRKELGDGDPGMPAFRTKLMQSFEIVSQGSTAL